MVRAKPTQINFPPFRLDPSEQRLYRNEAPISLRPKSFEVLQYLSARPGKLVSKEEILEAVWPDTTVTDTVLKVCIREIRDALGDHAASARYIETAHRRGYRFIAKIERLDQPTRAARTQFRTIPIVGREREIVRLASIFQRADQGTRQLVFITGEPGIGKTTLVAAFLSQPFLCEEVLIARGQCLEQYGSNEAFLPMLEAVSRLCRSGWPESLIFQLRKHAPTWVAQMPWLAGDSVEPSEIMGATRERMLREIAEAIDAITNDNFLVLVLEDLHWSDYSTLDLIAYLARRSEPSRLMIIGTYRPAEVSAKHPLNALKQELQAHQQCEELPVTLLDEKSVAERLKGQFRRNRFPDDLPRSIHERTDGNPMFVVNLIEFLVANGLIARDGEEWVLTKPLETVELGIPHNVRQIIEKQIESLSDEEQRILETGSVAGVEFSTSTIAAALDQDNIQVEEVCERLVKRHLFVRFAGIESARGEIAGRYGFIHSLYQNAFYDHLPVAKCAHLHKKIAHHLETELSERAGETAAELAMHFEKARDYRRTLRYLQQAAQNANHRSANREAETLARRGLDLLPKLDNVSERIELELLLQTTLGTSLSATQGYGASEVRQAYTRARELCREFGNHLQLAPVLWGLWRFYLIRSDLDVAYELAQHFLQLAQNEQDAALLVGANLALGTTCDNRGEFESARNHFEQGLSLYDPLQQKTYLLLYGSDPAVTLRSFNAWALWSLGQPDLALNTAREAAALSAKLRHPETVCFATFFNAWVHQLRREPEETLKHAADTIELADKNGIAQWTAFGSSLYGWAMAEQGQITEGIKQMRQTLNTYSTIGSEISRPHFLGLLAEALMKNEQVDEALRVLSDALVLVTETGQRYYESELHRLRGELLAKSGNRNEAEQALRRSIAVATMQKARSFEQRAITSLAQLTSSGP
jgi:predicted ATPase